MNVARYQWGHEMFQLNPHPRRCSILYDNSSNLITMVHSNMDHMPVHLLRFQQGLVSCTCLDIPLSLIFIHLCSGAQYEAVIGKDKKSHHAH